MTTPLPFDPRRSAALDRVQARLDRRPTDPTLRVLKALLEAAVPAFYSRARAA